MKAKQSARRSACLLLELRLVQLLLESLALLRHRLCELARLAAALLSDGFDLFPRTFDVNHGQLLAHLGESTLLALLGKAVLRGAQHPGSHRQLVLELLGRRAAGGRDGSAVGVDERRTRENLLAGRHQCIHLPSPTQRCLAVVGAGKVLGGVGARRARGRGPRLAV